MKFSYLWDGQACNGDAWDSIRLEEGEAVARPPLEDRKDVLERQNKLPDERFVLELVERVIGEEELTQPLPEGLKGGGFRWHRDLVDFQRRRERAWEVHGILKVSAIWEILYPVGVSNHVWNWIGTRHTRKAEETCVRMMATYSGIEDEHYCWFCCLSLLFHF